MSLFQNTVLKKYSNLLDKKKLDEKWQLFTTLFHNNDKQQNIRNSKEEQYQAIFLHDLFVQVLGYTLHPNTNYNLITEQKNETNSKKADGAIILNDNIHAVIELKGTQTTDLNKIELQAFGYKNNQKSCNYVIISNFEKLRFYVENATEFIEFNLFTLCRDEFNLLFVCLSIESMQIDLPKKIKYESVSNEDKITKELYKDYSSFRKELYNDIVLLNPHFNKLELFKKTQKLLDRFLFIFFAEDRQLLPTNLIFSINLEWQKLREARIVVSLYDRYKMYFQDLNTGARVSLPAFGKHTNEIVTAQYDIYAYNGGLFQPDDLLNNIAINDDLLFKHTKKLSEYDFDSEIDVNILGHIFENSLNEIDEITNEINAKLSGFETLELDKTKSKRKKDGVFYTPKYITKYIVDNTVGKLCEEKKIEIELDETKYSTDKKITIITKKNLVETLDQYRKWLLQLKIVDPACGSGAFLNQALEFLIAEHKYIDELQAKLFGDALVLSDVEGSILENNLFGVDLNEESVEIAKLSLWLRTAQRNRKLNSLNNNIKCGNSLIDNKTIVGDKAFNWQNEFKQVFTEKNKKAYHLVFTTHNSRTSQRMINYNVKKGPSLELNLVEEIALTEIFKNIIKDNSYNCLAFNICKDHVHLILVCEEVALTPAVQKIKSISSKLFNRLRTTVSNDKSVNSMGHDPLEFSKDNVIPMGQDPLKLTKDNVIPMGQDPLKFSKENDRSIHNNHLWSQKFFFAQLDELVWGDVSPRPGYIATDTYLENAKNYIKTNRQKHNLPDSKELKNIINSFLTDIDIAYKTEYNGGFDVVIGNPPYGVNFNESEKKYLASFDPIVPDFEIYIYFISLYKTILRENKVLSYIFPNTFLSTLFGKKYREFIFENTQVYQIIDLSNDVTFVDASVRTCIFSFRKSKEDYNSELLKVENKEFKRIDIVKKISILEETDNILSLFSQDKDEKKLIYKLQKNKTLGEFHRVSQGLIPYDKYRGHDEFTIKNRIWHSDFQKDSTYKKELKGGDVNRYSINWNGNLWISYGNWLAAPREKKFFTSERILIREITADRLFCGYTEEEFYNTPSAINIINEKTLLNLKYTITLLNSKLIGWLHNKVSPKANKGLFPKILINDIRIIPLVEISSTNQQPFIEKADLMLTLSKELQLLVQKFSKYFSNQFKIEKLSSKIERWYVLTFEDFIKEINKSIKTQKGTPITKKEEFDWIDLFEENKAIANKLQNEITIIDKAIDNMVYKLYGLSEEEIGIVERS